MKSRTLNARRIGMLMIALCAFGLLTPATMAEEAKFAVNPVVEAKVKELPPGPLFWRLDNFPTLKQAQGASPSTLWLKALPGSGPRPAVPGTLQQETYIRIYIPVKAIGAK